MDLYAITGQEILERISRHCPEALGAYLHCINRANPEGKLFLSRDRIEIEMSESFTKFNNQIKKLALENLLKWMPFNEGISIEMVAIDEDV